MPVLLNPAPAAELPGPLWSSIDYLIPNETEASILTGLIVDDRPSASRAARILRDRGVGHVLLTMGAQGVLIADRHGERHLPAQAVCVADTTAAGDCFIGGVVAGLCEGMALDDAAMLGIAAASICVTRPGAPSQPCPIARKLRAEFPANSLLDGMRFGIPSSNGVVHSM